MWTKLFGCVAVSMAIIVPGAVVMKTHATAGTETAKNASTMLWYCPLTDTASEECCCKIVDGKWVCQDTGTVSDECCCIRLDAAGVASFRAAAAARGAVGSEARPKCCPNGKCCNPPQACCAGK